MIQQKDSTQNQGSVFQFPKGNVSEEKRIKYYDFRKPKKFTKEHLRDLNTVNENIIRIFASNLSSILRVFCEISLGKVEECRYAEYINSLPDKTLVGLVDLNSKGTSFDVCTMLMHIPSKINFFLIDILLGGTGNGYKYKREYTEIEISILKNFYEKLTGFLNEAWKSLLDTECTVNEYETNPRLAQFISQDDSVIVLSFQVKIREVTDTFSFCIPSINLDEMLNISNMKFSKGHYRQENEKDIARKETIYSTLQESTLELSAVLGTIQLEMQDILNLQVSDIIQLNKKIDSDISVNVDGMPRFTAKLGEHKIKKAVKICGLKSLSDEEYNNY